MRGEVLHYDEAQGFGFIAGSDGNRYTFRREDLRQAFPIAKGMPIEFRENGAQARDISPIGGTVQAAPTGAPSAVPVAPAGAPPAAASPHPPHFGRFAAPTASPVPDDTGLWDYFWAGLTRNYANFRGRARRKEYWGYVLFFALVLTAVTLFGVSIDFSVGNMEGQDMPIVMIALLGASILALIVPSVAMAVRRQHDIGLSGWFYFVFLIPYIGNVILLVFALIPSQKHANKWGPVPSGITIPPPYVQPTPAVPTPGTGQ